MLIGARRREISRVSELLQAQMLQDININPVQPALGETNLKVGPGAGARTPGFNEYTALFERDMVQLNGTGLVGNNDTDGGEAVASARLRPAFDQRRRLRLRHRWLARQQRPAPQHPEPIYQGAITPEFNPSG